MRKLLLVFLPAGILLSQPAYSSTPDLSSFKLRQAQRVKQELYDFLNRLSYLRLVGFRLDKVESLKLPKEALPPPKKKDPTKVYLEKLLREGRLR